MLKAWLGTGPKAGYQGQRWKMGKHFIFEIMDFLKTCIHFITLSQWGGRSGGLFIAYENGKC
jgi:hypothetical protein